MITAQEARNLYALSRREDDMNKLNELITNAAARGLRMIRVPYDMVEISGYSINFKCPGIKDELESLGFNVTSESEERQFVDVWLEVVW